MTCHALYATERGQFFSEFLDSQSMRCHLKHKSDQVAPVKLHLFLPKKETNYMIRHIVKLCMHLYFYLYIYYIILLYIYIYVYVYVYVTLSYVTVYNIILSYVTVYNII